VYQIVPIPFVSRHEPILGGPREGVNLPIRHPDIRL